MVVPAAHFIAIMVTIVVMVPVLVTVSVFAMVTVVCDECVAAVQAHNSLFDRMFSSFLRMLSDEPLHTGNGP
jgi:hypothetical protein